MHGPHWIKQWIADLALLNEQFRDDDGKIDFEALGREEVAFRTALMTHDFRKSKRAQETFEKAKAAYDACVENGKKGGRPRKDNNYEQRTGVNSSNGLESAKSPANTRSAGGKVASVPPVPKAPSEPEVLNLAYSGEFGNVQLTQEEYSELGIRFGNKRALDRAIDSLSARIENGEKNPKSCYAELIKWVNYREDMDEKKELEESKPKMSNMEKSWIAAMKKVEMM